MVVNNNKLNLIIPEDLDEVYITGGAITSTMYNIRLILFNDELSNTGGSINSNEIDLVRTAKTEVVMHPAVAKQLCDLLVSELENYEKKLDELNK